MYEIVRFVAIRSIMILANPKAGGFYRRKVEDIASILIRHGLRVEICYTKQSGEISRISEDQHVEVDAIAIHGGDGSISEAIAGLHRRRGWRPVLIVIPGGTADVLAKELDLPVASSRIAQSIINGKTLPLHYGLANGRPFFLMASAGFDAAVVYAISPGLKQLLGKFAFVVAAVKLVFQEKLPDVLVEAEGQTIRCRLAIVTNSACYGGGYLISPDNSVIRPGLRLVSLADDNFISLVRAGWRVITGRVEDGAEFFVRSITNVRLAGDRPVPVQIDGEAFGTTPVELEPVSEALRMRGPIAPPEMCNGLMVPIVAFDQIYSFDRDALIKAIPKPEKTTAAQFGPAAEELFNRIMLLKDNAGATDEHRALNYLAMRYPAIYAKAAEEFARDFSLSGVDVRPSLLSGTCRIVDVIFSYTNRNTDFTEKFFVRVDVTGEFPFLVTKLSPYFDR